MDLSEYMPPSSRNTVHIMSLVPGERSPTWPRLAKYYTVPDKGKTAFIPGLSAWLLSNRPR